MKVILASPKEIDALKLAAKKFPDLSGLVAQVTEVNKKPCMLCIPPKVTALAV